METHLSSGQEMHFMVVVVLTNQTNHRIWILYRGYTWGEPCMSDSGGFIDYIVWYLMLSTDWQVW